MQKNGRATFGKRENISKTALSTVIISPTYIPLEGLEEISQETEEHKLETEDERTLKPMNHPARNN